MSTHLFLIILSLSHQTRPKLHTPTGTVASPEIGQKRLTTVNVWILSARFLIMRWGQYNSITPSSHPHLPFRARPRTRRFWPISTFTSRLSVSHSFSSLSEFSLSSKLPLRSSIPSSNPELSSSRSLACDRIRIHRNFMVSLVLLYLTTIGNRKYSASPYHHLINLFLMDCHHS